MSIIPGEYFLSADPIVGNARGALLEGVSLL